MTIDARLQALPPRGGFGVVSAAVGQAVHHDARTGSQRPRLVYLLDASSGVERRLLEQWIAAHHQGPEPWQALPIPPSRRRARRAPLDPKLEACIAADDDPLLAPLRIAWLPPARNGSGTIRLRDLLLGDPRDPGPLRQSWLGARAPGRWQVVAGDAAPVSELRDRWRRAGVAETTGLAEFVVRQAALALERAERRVRGMRYKVPRFVRQEILARPAFRGAVARLAAQSGTSEGEAMKRASQLLGEIAATHSPYVIDLSAHLIRRLYSQGYDDLVYDREQLARIYALAQRHPVVFLPSHKSNLDHLVLQYALHENGHPPNHTAGGINMNFFPVGPLVRRSGVFFIRRTFKDDALYKLVLRHYVDYLIEKRFPLEWYIEGGRSRSGKLLPPRFGLLVNVVDAYQRGKSEDVHLIPVAIAYDQISDVADYTAEQRGGAKQRESFAWFLGVVKRLRRRSGRIHLRFGEPVSLRTTLGPPDAPADAEGDEHDLAIQKLAFEVSVRINRVTPITPTSLVMLALLGCGDKAVTVHEVERALVNLVDQVERRNLPTTGDLDLRSTAGVQHALDTMVESGVVSCFAEGVEPVYAIAADQHLTAAYYRNTVIHFFVTGAIGELALLRAAEDDVTDRPAEFWAEAMRLRDLLKFEFFFADKETFRDELRREMTLADPDWEARLGEGRDAIQTLLRTIKPFNAHRVLLPYLEAYQVVGDALASDDATKPFEQGPFLTRCLALGKQYLLQRRIRRGESVSRVLFETALRLAANRQLLAPGPDVAERRRAFASEIRQAIRRAEVIDLLAANRRAGLIA